MRDVITEDMLDLMRTRCRELLQNFLSTRSDFQSVDARKLDLPAWMEPWLWQILAPIVVAIAGGLSIEFLKEKLLPKPTTEAEARKMVGREIVTDSVAVRPEYIEHVQQVLAPLGGTEGDCRIIVREVVRTVEMVVEKNRFEKDASGGERT